MQRKLWYLRRLNLFAGMAHEEIEEISRHLRDRACHRGQMILDEEGRNDRIYLIKSGTVRIYRLSPEGRELTTAILRPGQMFGTSALFGETESEAIAEALDEAYVCDASAEQFMRLMARHPALAAKISVLLARQLLRLEQQLARLAFQDAPTRLAQALLVLAEDNGGQLPPNLTHEELATLIGSTRATVTKTLAEFARDGAVEIGYRHLVILDFDRLQSLADSDGH